MTESEGLLNKHQRKKAARKKRQQSERQAHRDLDAVTGEAIERALELAPTRVADVIDVPLASVSEAFFVRKRINDALRVEEWLDDVRVWVWQVDEHHSKPLSANGETSGFELRMDPVFS